LKIKFGRPLGQGTQLFLCLTAGLWWGGRKNVKIASYGADCVYFKSVHGHGDPPEELIFRYQSSVELSVDHSYIHQTLPLETVSAQVGIGYIRVSAGIPTSGDREEEIESAARV